jgi:hypothetical protein
MHLRNYVLMFYLHLNKRGMTQQSVEFYFPIQTVKVAYLKKSNYPDFLQIRMARRPN